MNGAENHPVAEVMREKGCSAAWAVYALPVLPICTSMVFFVGGSRDTIARLKKNAFCCRRGRFEWNGRDGQIVAHLAYLVCTAVHTQIDPRIAWRCAPAQRRSVEHHSIR